MTSVSFATFKNFVGKFEQNFHGVQKLGASLMKAPGLVAQSCNPGYTGRQEYGII
jgi:hypothetical protein